MALKQGMSRRRFLGAVGVGATGLALGRGAGAAVGPSEKIRLGVIGCGGMGSRHIEALCDNDQCTLVALCDVYQPRYTKNRSKVEELTGQRPDVYQDFRHVLDRKDIDAIFVVTPDHWHPLLTILGCQAGKDVYVEKPVCTVVEEGRAMVDAARRYGRIVQAGTQQRSMPIFQEAMEIVRGGRLGTITSASAYVGVNGWGVGEHPMDPPPNLDWDLWLGPASKVPFSRERFQGFMGWHDYARGGELTNWGVHLMDVVHWGIGQDRPLNVQAMGGSYREHAGSDNYEIIDAMLEYEGCSVTWEQRHSNWHFDPSGYGMIFQGTAGALQVDRGHFIVKPEGLGIPKTIGAPELSWANRDHHNNFFECIRTRKRPAAEIEQGLRSTTAVLLAGVALKAQRKLEWDGAAERFVNDEAANRYLSRAYRAPWHL